MEKINSMMEEQGAAWGMRREVVIRAVQVVNETVNCVLAFNPHLERVQVSLEFNELRNRLLHWKAWPPMRVSRFYRPL